MSVVHRVGREYLLQIAAFAVAILDRLLIPGILLRSLGVDGFSSWTVAIAFASFLPVMDLGITRYFSNRILALRAMDREEEAIAAYRHGTAILLSLSTIAIILLLGWSRLFPAQTGDAAGDAAVATLLVPALLALAAGQMMGLRQSLYRAHQQFARETVFRGASDLCRIGLICGAALLGASLQQLGWLWFGAVMVTIVAPVIVDTGTRFPQFRVGHPHQRSASMGTIAAASSGYWLHAVSATLFAAAPILVIGAVAGSAAIVVQFTLMRTIANLVRQVLQLFANVFGLELARRLAVADHHGFASVFFESNRLLGVQAAVGAAILLFMGHDLFVLWTDRAGLFNPTMLMLAILPPILLPGMMLSTEALAYAERPWAVVRIRGLQLVLTIALYVVLPIADVGMRMMMALAVAEVAGFGLPLLFAMRGLNHQISVRRQATTAAITLAALAGASAIMAPVWLWPLDGLFARLATGAALGGLASTLLIYTLGFDQARRAHAHVILRGWLGR